MRTYLVLLGIVLGIVLSVSLAAHAQTDAGSVADQRRSGFTFMSPATQSMQQDDTLNPGMLWVKDGAALWQKKTGKSTQSCVACHGVAATSMRGVATRYPAFDVKLQRPVNLSQRINLCRQTHQQAAPLAAESHDLLSLDAYIGNQSRGMAVTPPIDVRLEAFRERGRQQYLQRIGQLNMSCAQCHDDSAGQRLGSSPIPQAHATGYPIYRLEWQGLGSLQRRLRSCMNGVRAEPFAYGAQEMVELELYLASRAKGMPIETPAVRP